MQPSGDPNLASVVPESMSSRVGVGVWGLGRHARKKILPALQACPSTILVGVTTRDGNVARDEADLYQCEYWPSPDDMLRAADVDAVYVATPTGLHHDHGMRVLHAGKHLWCEKAMAATLYQVQDLVRESRVRELALCEGLMYMYHPQFSFICDTIAGHAFGKVLSANCQFGLPHLDQPGFRFTRELGGGALLDIAPYPLSATLKLLGPELTVLQSLVSEPPGSDVDMHGFALVSTHAGACAFLEWGYERAYRNEISIWGENASLHADLIFSKPPAYVASVRVRDRHGKVEEVEIEAADSFSLMFSAFVDAVDDPARRDDFRGEVELRAKYLDRIRQR